MFCFSFVFSGVPGGVEPPSVVPDGTAALPLMLRHSVSMTSPGALFCREAWEVRYVKGTCFRANFSCEPLMSGNSDGVRAYPDGHPRRQSVPLKVLLYSAVLWYTASPHVVSAPRTWVSTSGTARVTGCHRDRTCQPTAWARISLLLLMHPDGLYVLLPVCQCAIAGFCRECRNSFLHRPGESHPRPALGL